MRRLDEEPIPTASRSGATEQARTIRAEAFGSTSALGVHSAPRTVPFDREESFDRRELDGGALTGWLRERPDVAPTPPPASGRSGGFGAGARSTTLSSSLHALDLAGLTRGPTTLSLMHTETEQEEA